MPGGFNEQVQEDLFGSYNVANTQSLLYPQRQVYMAQEQQLQQPLDTSIQPSALNTVTNAAQWMEEQSNVGQASSGHSLGVGGVEATFLPMEVGDPGFFDPDFRDFSGLDQEPSDPPAGGGTLIVQHGGFEDFCAASAVPVIDDADLVHNETPIKTSTQQVRRKNGPARKCEGIVNGKCCGRNAIEIDEFDIYCKRCFNKLFRGKAGPPVFTFPGGITSFEQAQLELYPMFEPLIPDEHLSMEHCDSWEDHIIERLILAVNKPYQGRDKNAPYYMRQQSVLNAKTFSESKKAFSDKSVNVRLRMLYRCIAVVHCGGQIPYQLGGDNIGYGAPDASYRFGARINRIIEILELNKRVALDVILGRGVLAFAMHPDQYDKRKTQNMDSNGRKQVRHMIGTKVVKAYKAKGVNEDDIEVERVLAREVTKTAEQSAGVSVAGEEGQEDGAEDGDEDEESDNGEDFTPVGNERLSDGGAVVDIQDDTKLDGSLLGESRAKKRKRPDPSSDNIGAVNTRSRKKAKQGARRTTIQTRATTPNMNTKKSAKTPKSAADIGDPASLQPASQVVTFNAQTSLTPLMDQHPAAFNSQYPRSLMPFPPHATTAPTVPTQASTPNFNLPPRPADLPTRPAHLRTRPGESGPLIDHPIFPHPTAQTEDPAPKSDFDVYMQDARTQPPSSEVILALVPCSPSAAPQNSNDPSSCPSLIDLGADTEGLPPPLILASIVRADRGVELSKAGDEDEAAGACEFAEIGSEELEGMFDALCGGE